MKLSLNIFGRELSVSGKSAADTGGGVFAKLWERVFTTKTAGELAQPMKNSVWVQRAVKLVAQPISGVPLQFFTVSGNNPRPFADPGLTAFWDDPFQRMSFEDGVEALVGWLKLRGECFLVMDDTWLAAGGVKSQLIIARPQDIRPIARGPEVLGWVYSDGAVAYTLLPEQVAQARFWNPYDRFRGLAEYEAAHLAAEADYLAGKFANNLMKNNGDRGPYVVAKNGLPTDEQREMIINQLRDKKRLAQEKDAFRPLFLAGDIDIKDPMIQAVDAAFVAQRAENRREIYAAFGVPPGMAEVTASYSIGSASDRFRLLEDTCIPTARKLAAAIEQVAVRLLNVSGLKARFNFDEHSVMQQVRAERVSSAKTLWDMGVPVATAAGYLNMGLPRFRGDDVSYLPFSVAPAGAGLDAADFNEPPDAGDSAAEDLGKVFAKFKAAPVCQPLTDAAPSCSCALSPAGKAPLWQQHAAARLKVAKMYQAKISKLLFAARREMLEKLDALAELSGKAAVAQKMGVAQTLMFNLSKFSGVFEAVMRAAGQFAYDTAGAEAWAEFGQGADNPWKSPPQAVKDFLAARENKLSGVPAEIFEQIRGRLQASVDRGDSIAGMGDAIREAFNACDAGRARAIAMTETSAAYGTARQESMKQAGIGFKKWVTSGNDNVRAAHRAVEGVIVGVDESWLVDGEELMHPGDSNGSPENVINCHCIGVAVSDAEAAEYFKNQEEHESD